MLPNALITIFSYLCSHSRGKNTVVFHFVFCTIRDGSLPDSHLIRTTACGLDHTGCCRRIYYPHILFLCVYMYTNMCCDYSWKIYAIHDICNVPNAYLCKNMRILNVHPHSGLSIKSAILFGFRFTVVATF